MDCELGSARHPAVLRQAWRGRHALPCLSDPQERVRSSPSGISNIQHGMSNVQVGCALGQCPGSAEHQLGIGHCFMPNWCSAFPAQ